MKKLIFTALFAVGLTASPAGAQRSQHPHSAGAPAEAQRDQPGMMQGGMMQGGMMQSSEAMKAHKQKMHEMRALIERAQAATDPAERQRLMEQHHQMMQTQMASMMKGENANMMRACQERMAMMHDMMAQMEAEQEIAPGK